MPSSNNLVNNRNSHRRGRQTENTAASDRLAAANQQINDDMQNAAAEAQVAVGTRVFTENIRARNTNLAYLPKQVKFKV